MSIRVTCTNCHTRFDVHEKFAGKEGPCPKCKTTITIPAADEQVVVHEPEHSGPTDSKGRSVLKPISRAETVLSGVQITLIAATILGFLAVAFILKNYFTDKEAFPVWLLAIGAIVMAVPVTYVGYALLRNQDREPFYRNALLPRLGICIGAYSAFWLIMPLMGYAFPNNDIGAIIGVIAMIAAGGFVGMMVLEFDYIFGVLHYGMYLGLCLLVRLIVGLNVLPGAFEAGESVPSTVISMLSVTFSCLV